MTIRLAEAGDATGVAQVQVASWREAYRGLFPDDVLDGLDVPERAASWETWLKGTESVTWVTDVDGTIVAFASIGPARDFDEDPAAREVYALYVAPARWRTGLGIALLDRALEEQGGDTLVILWVLRDNAPARRFYERLGWRADGAEKDFEFAGASVPEVRYRRSL